MFGSFICWPLGLAAEATPPDQCRVRRAAWTLDGTAPPTLPDRVRSGGLIETAWVDARHTRRLRPGCETRAPRHTPTPMSTPAATRWVPLEYVRWPTLLEPWIERSLRSEAERIPWAADCAARGPSRALRITGIEHGSVIRPAPGSPAAVVRVQVVGSRERVDWLLDGRLVGSTEPHGEGLRLTLGRTGEHALTAIDPQGRFERVRFSVR